MLLLFIARTLVRLLSPYTIVLFQDIPDSAKKSGLSMYLTIFNCPSLGLGFDQLLDVIGTNFVTIVRLATMIFTHTASAKLSAKGNYCLGSIIICSCATSAHCRSLVTLSLCDSTICSKIRCIIMCRWRNVPHTEITSGVLLTKRKSAKANRCIVPIITGCQR
jgi:hypothetical protein